jgi:hypothetical protein
VTQYIVIALIVAAAVGWGTWQQQLREKADLKVEAREASLAMAEGEIERVAKVADHNKAVAEGFRDEVSRQREIAAAKEKKAADRLRENNELRRKISNATENPPVPDAIELVLDSIRLRSAVPGTPGTDDGDKDRSGGEADSAGRDVSAGPEPAAETPGS